ncbi:MAG: hypothetical protein F6K25_10315 [Okeania sp. SIO2G4]|uniref:hypothetical protein n=1 Tax=unclassified Okeania TaxID=2634635 RepID=UPI0013B8B5BE|nr:MULTISPECIES: hypothetical protein [unclassified Okeania]NEP05575.1 hypothetical protein [Okeania sp. SIO4D6]NEP39873.1 hypothetical protein [Okeania sp. SIO2H7]NEP72101.1 hypothetical protein [Okeania sp. SIO2G5]NEP92959.1 hypothetical protein [Okeania sp. SIO2F5]NEQ91079.1 hypothetical protein [Okeania sp. SIO2G4]
MSNPKKLPNSIRYFRGRFRHLTKPLVWGPIAVASLVLLFVWELTVHPEWLTVEDDYSVTSGNIIIDNLSPEEISIISDIDSSSVLVEDLKNYENLQFNSSVIPEKILLNRLKGESKNESTPPKNSTKLQENLTNLQPQTTTNNLPPQNKLDNSQLLTSPLLRSLNILDESDREEKKEKPANALQNALDDYQRSKNQSQASSNSQSQTNNFNLYPTEIKPRDIRPSPFPGISTSNSYQSPQNNNFNSPLPPININQPKPYYTDRSGTANQNNNPSNSPGSNYSLQRQPANPNLPPLPTVPNGLANNQNGVNGINNGRVSNYYSNQGYPQNQQQQYNYGVNPNQVNQNLPSNPSNNPFSRRNNSFNRGYGERWNNPFNNN